MMLQKQKKGITPVIAVILLLMMTVAAAGAAFFWFVRIQSELQGGTESYTGSLSEKVASNIEVVRAEYKQFYDANSTNRLVPFGNLTLILKNTGNTRISLSSGATAPTTTWILADQDQNILCNDDWNDAPSECISGCGGELAPKATQKIILNLSGDCDIGNYSAITNGSVLYYQIDFSGQAATGGSFEK